MTYQIIITEEIANVAVTSESYPIIIEYNATNLSSNATYGNTEVQTYLASGTNTGNIITTANISGAYILGNGSALTGIVATSSYGNANVAANLAAFGSNPISTSGNVTAGYFSGNGSLLTNITGGNVSGTVANATYALNANASTFATQATFATTANAVAGANVSGTVANATYALNSNAATFATQATSATTANAVAGANVSGTVANATYALNANASTFAGTVTTAAQPNITSVGILSSLSASGNITGGNVVVPNGSKYYGDFTSGATAGRAVFQTTSTGTTGSTFLTALPGPGHVASGGAIGSATGLFASNDAANSSFTGMYATFSESQIRSSSFGTGAVNDLTFRFGPSNTLAATITPTGNVSAVGNITAGFFLGDGSQLTNLPAGTYGNANVAAYLPTYTGNVGAGNVIVSGIVYTPQVEAAGDLDLNTAGKVNVNGNIRVGDNNANTQIATMGTGDLILRTHEGDASQGSITIFDGANGNIALAPNGTGQVTATTISASGNVLGLNLIAAGNLQSTQQTVIGTANVGTTGNIVLSGKNIATDMAFNPDGGNATTSALSRINIGTGWNGNITHSATQNRLLVQDTFNRTNTGTNTQLFASDPIVNLTANVTNNSFRVQGVASRIRIGGGSAGNTIQLTGTAGSIASVAALQPNIDVGNVAPYNLGNTTISHATLNGGFITTYLGSFIGNAYGMIPGALATSTGNAQQAGNITNYTGFASQLGAGPYITGNLYAFYNGNVAGSAEANATGLSMAAAVRSATNYYFLRNDDDVAQNKIGSLRSYHEYQYPLATSGTVNIDKSNSQVQYLAPTANVTIGSLSNFVTNANDGTNNDAQSDTVTLIIKQGATPYTVTMPTGNASIKYASNVSTVGTSANSVTMINITGANVGGAALYLVTVSPEFV